MAQPGLKNITSLIEMAVFRGTEIHIEIFISPDEILSTQAVITQCNDETIAVETLAEVCGSETAGDDRFTGKNAVLRVPYFTEMAECSVVLRNSSFTEDNRLAVTADSRTEFNFINRRSLERIRFPHAQCGFSAYVNGRFGRRRALVCDAILDVSASSAAVRIEAPKENIDSLVIERNRKQVFMAEVDAARTMDSIGENGRRILFFSGTVNRGFHTRSIRRIVPPSDLPVFIEAEHPLISGCRIRGRMENFSKTGTAFLLDAVNVPVFAGLLLNPVRIYLPYGKPLVTSARIVHCTSAGDTADGGERLRIGVELLRLSDTLNLESNILYLQDIDTTLLDAQPQDFEKILNHLFLSKFIYHQKRLILQEYSSAVIATQIRLLEKNTISKTIISKKGTEVGGFVQYLKLHDHVWLVQHLAGGSRSAPEAGKKVVLATIDFFLNQEVNRGVGIDYVVCYYRPQNAYPMMLFDGFAQRIADPLISCAHEFTYCTVNHSRQDSSMLQDGNYICSKATGTDLEILEACVDATYGRIYRNVEALGVHSVETSRISREYRRYGLLRERSILCLKDAGRTVLAFAVCEHCSPGANLSELTNSFKVYFPGKCRSCGADALTVLLRAVLDVYCSYGITSPVYLASSPDDISDVFVPCKQYRYWYLDAAHFGDLKTHCLDVIADLRRHLRLFRDSGNGKTDARYCGSGTGHDDKQHTGGEPDG